MTNAQGNRGWAVVMVAAISMMLAAAMAAAAQSFTSLLSFNLADGNDPEYETLVQGFDGSLYGTTAAGGNTSCSSSGCGTVFKITPNGVLTTLYSFCADSGCTDGNSPAAGLSLSPDGTFYGTTVQGGNYNASCPYGCGTVFKITPNATLTTLYRFCSQVGCADGAGPLGALVQGANGNFYGTTATGGLASGAGTAFAITPQGTLTTLHRFGYTPTDGVDPYSGLIQGSDGDFYGTTFVGGTVGSSCPSGCGTVYRITPSGKYSILYRFDYAQAAYPWAALTQGSDGNLYGTTIGGGTTDHGTVFTITLNGSLTVLHIFGLTGADPDGDSPEAPLIQGTDGNYYGTTYAGGSGSVCYYYACGTAFRITSEGTLTTLHSFDVTDGFVVFGGLVQDTNGSFYGTTAGGGSSDACLDGCGTVYGLSVGLGPFVKTVPTADRAGTSVVILGTKLTGATRVTFNGTPATFTVESSTAIGATVPAGATTGPVQVVTPSGTLTSNVNFQILP
jgi:uncharacterized repeat protein (TIGR03803 family)